MQQRAVELRSTRGVHANGIDPSTIDSERQTTCCFSKRTVGPQDTENLVTGHVLDLGNTGRVPELHADLRRRQALLRELADLVDDLLGRGLEPGGRGAAVGEGRGRHALAVSWRPRREQIRKRKCRGASQREEKDGYERSATCFAPLSQPVRSGSAVQSVPRNGPASQHVQATAIPLPA